jgi:hypothetical protein
MTAAMTKDELQPYAGLIADLVSACVACSPSDWDEGTLTINSDGLHILYKLKNPASSNRAEISAGLRSACEELYFAMRTKGDLWTEFVLHCSRKDGQWGSSSLCKRTNRKLASFDLDSVDMRMFEGTWIGESLEKNTGRKLMFRSTYSWDGSYVGQYRVKFDDGVTDDSTDTKTWSLDDGVLTLTSGGSVSSYAMASLNWKKMKYVDAMSGITFIARRPSDKLEQQWDQFLQPTLLEMLTRLWKAVRRK